MTLAKSKFVIENVLVCEQPRTQGFISAPIALAEIKPEYEVGLRDPY
jgi:hypothetical protein